MGATIAAAPAGDLARRLISFNDHNVSLGATATSYRVRADWSDFGVFADRCVVGNLRCDEPEVVIEQNTNNTTRGGAEWTIYVPASAGAGYYGGALDLTLSLEVAGHGWSGEAGPFEATWGDPVEVV